MKCHLKSMRAVATAQPKAAKFPPVVREHKAVVRITGPFEALAKAPVAPMQRLKTSWPVPDSCQADVPMLPKGAQLLRVTPLRSSGGMLDTGNSRIGLFEQAWGIPFEPEEFILEAVQRGHPRLFSRLVPSVLQEAISNNFCEGSLHTLPRDRSLWFAKWTERAKQLRHEDVEIKNALPEHASKDSGAKKVSTLQGNFIGFDLPGCWSI